MFARSMEIELLVRVTGETTFAWVLNRPFTIMMKWEGKRRH